MKQGKHNAEVQAFIAKNGLELEEQTVQKPVVHVQVKKKNILQQFKKYSRQFMHHSLDTFSKWARK